MSCSFSSLSFFSISSSLHLPYSPVESRVLESDPACKNGSPSCSFMKHLCSIIYGLSSAGASSWPEWPRPRSSRCGCLGCAINVAGPKPGFAGFALARPGATSNKRYWLVENGSLGRRYRLKPAWSPCCFCWAAAGRKSATPIRCDSLWLSVCLRASPRLLLSA